MTVWRPFIIAQGRNDRSIAPSFVPPLVRCNCFAAVIFRRCVVKEVFALSNFFSMTLYIQNRRNEFFILLLILKKENKSLNLKKSISVIEKECTVRRPLSPRSTSALHRTVTASKQLHLTKLGKFSDYFAKKLITLPPLLL